MPLLITSFGESETPMPARIDAKGYPNGVLIHNSRYVEVKNLEITGDGYGTKCPQGEMRIGVQILATGEGQVKGIVLDKLKILMKNNSFLIPCFRNWEINVGNS